MRTVLLGSMGCKPAVKGTRNPTSHGGPIKTYRGPSAGVELRTNLGERQREPDDGAMFFTWRAKVWCTMSYSDERDDLTSNKMNLTWKTRTGIEADAWEEFLKSADPLILPRPKRTVPDLADENLLIEEWEYETLFCESSA